ncbi:TonB-dependent receptor [Erythrobacter sp. JK5]|uniref:TonB-dependent receptor n=1 Tax=Erythrobacter sp. JK5 TaxID=2829500 RepID=UPI001BA5B6AA|nr:TonB-dependent receptor [Erythrobacter sp. JK5]QUL39259.1 TonB-dependent receptor [Erythrobacter sp. JK5]
MTSRSTIRTRLCAGACLAALAASPAWAQPQSPPQDPPAETARPDERPNELGAGSGEIVVRAERLAGQLDVEQAPILELGEQDIAAEGVTSIADLITQITNQTGSARGRGGGGQPVLLINGIRIGSFREFANYPPEALARVEVFPEEVAQRFGFPPDRRVINLILKENYRNAEVEFEFEGPSRGGYHQREQEIGFLQIADGGRINVNFEANDSSALTEPERDIIQTPGSVSDIATDPDQAAFRSLVADSRSLTGNISWAKAIIDSGISLSANASYTRGDSRSLRGLNTVVLTDSGGDSALRTFGADSPLEQRTGSDTFSTAGSLTKPINAFRLTTTFDASLSESETEIDRRFDTTALQADAFAGRLALDAALPRAFDAGFDLAATRSINASTLTTLRGPIAQLPGGELLATFDLGYEWTNLDGSDTRNPLGTDLTRGDLSTGANLVLPITSRRNGFADALGSFTLNAQVGLNHLSDFGTLGDYTLGLTWGVTDRLDLSASYIVREVAPALDTLGNPEVQFFNVPVFDFTNGETVLATVTTGGNPDLRAETQRDWKFALNWELPFVDNTRFTIEYVRNRSDDVTRGFPIITPEIEAAFPGRITRDAGGTLTAVDRRFVTFAETRANRLQFSLFTRGSIGGGREEGEERSGRGGPPRGGGMLPVAEGPTAWAVRRRPNSGSSSWPSASGYAPMTGSNSRSG